MSVKDAGIVLIGFGNMGQALARGWLRNGVDPASIVVVDPSGAARAAAASIGIRVAEHVTGVALSESKIDVVVLAVKPSQLVAALAVLDAAGVPLYLSIVAGKTIADIAGVVGPDAAVVRAMPNTPAAIGKGVTGLCANDAVTETGRTLCAELMAAVGSVEWIADEGQMDAVTAVSGSGPAYVFLLIESLAAAGRAVGLDAALAERLAVATVAGAGGYAAESGLDAAELRRRVTSPNGTTAAALDVLRHDDAFTRLVREAVVAAERRSRELSAE